MAKSQLRGNREAKKPKQSKPKIPASSPAASAPVTLGEKKKKGR
jgi:hypothetical protein